ncbi:MAG: hypothetical protein ACRC0X_06770 [Brevinema sp.]
MESNTISQLILMILGILTILLCLSNIILSKKIKKLSQELFSLQRSTNHKDTVLETTLSQFTQDLPIEKHPHTQNKQTTHLIENLLHKFSIRLNKKLHEKLQQEQNIWNEKFSLLLTLMNKTEKDLQQVRDHRFKESWISITELRQKAQLLFNDMQEDGVFYRIQSLWQLSTLSLQQQNPYDAFRHSTAALRLYHDSKPTLPLSHKIIWNIGNTFIESSKTLEKKIQQEIIKKFQITSKDILELFQETENFESNIETLQKIRIWYNQFTQL